MSRVHQKDVEQPEQPEHPEPPATERTTERAGKVVVDARGRNVWKWAKDAAKDVIDSTSVLLKRLENKDLALESTQKVPVVSGAQPGEKSAGPKAAKPADSNAKAAKEAATKSRHWHPAMKPDQGSDRGGGFDPYNSR